MQRTDIEWVKNPDGSNGYTWNPVTGCTPISAGCQNCYAKAIAERFKDTKAFPYGFDMHCYEERLNEPYKLKKPSSIFVCSMADIFHEKVPSKFIHKIFNTINNLPQHKFYILTKRIERLWELIPFNFINNNTWLGISVENSTEQTMERVEIFRRLSVGSSNFISFEPLISEIDFNFLFYTSVKWVIVGGESGSGARIMKKEWVQEIFDICQKNKIPFFFKGWGTATMPKSHPDYFKFNGVEHKEIP